MFKLINDTYGHGCGDATLVELVAVCKETLREVDVLGRIGGEEFAIVLPETELDDAYRVAERLRREIAKLKLSAEDVEYGITVSMGICAPRQGEDSIQQLMKRADDALYRAKRKGRNQVVVCNKQSADSKPGPDIAEQL